MADWLQVSPTVMVVTVLDCNLVLVNNVCMYITMYICINPHACICKYILQVNVVHIKSGAFVHGCINVKLLLHMHRIVMMY